MTIPSSANPKRSRHLLRSTAAVAAGFLAVAALSLITDEVLHLAGVYPPWGEPMYDPRLNLLALSYRILFTIAGGYLTARLAPSAPMRHVMVCGILGFATGSAGAIVAIRMANLGPDWYPIALALSGFPCVWLGGLLHVARTRNDRTSGTRPACL